MSDIMKLVGILEQRAAWLKKEWEAGGDYQHLWTRREEVLYVLGKIASLSPTPNPEANAK